MAEGLHEHVVAQGGLRIIAHRAPRVAPHRQPAARPFGPPGRPGLLALLPVAGRSADAHLRRRPRASAIMDRLKMPEGEAIEAGIVTRSHRERAAQGRGAQLRHPQAAARIRRRLQRPAQGDLPAAQRNPRRERRCRRRSRRCARAASPTWCASTCRRNRWRSSGTCPASRRRCADEWRHRRCRCSSRSQAASRITDEDVLEKVLEAANEAFDAKVAAGRPGELHAVRAHRAAAEHRHALARAPGRARLPAPGHPPARLCAEATRSRNTSARPSSCSASCSTR